MVASLISPPLRRRARNHLRPIERGGGRKTLRDKIERGAQGLRQEASERLRQPGGRHGEAKNVRARQDEAQDAAKCPVEPVAAIGLFDMTPRVIDEVHVVHPGRAGRHAGEAGEAAVDMLDDFRRRRAIRLQHVLDEVDAPARAVEFVAEQHIGRAGRGAESAMHAGAQNLVGFRNIGIGKLREAEFGFHVADSRLIRPRLRMFFGSKLWRTRSPKAARPACWG